MAKWVVRQVFDNPPCTGMHTVFFGYEFEKKADKEDREAVARAVCFRCEYLEPCRAGAVARNEPAGIWGATNVADRRRYHRNDLRKAVG